MRLRVALPTTEASTVPVTVTTVVPIIGEEASCEPETTNPRRGTTASSERQTICWSVLIGCRAQPRRWLAISALRAIRPSGNLDPHTLVMATST